MGGGDTAEQSGAEEGGDNVEEVVPGTGAGAGADQMLMLEGPEEEVDRGDTEGQSDAEEGGDAGHDGGNQGSSPVLDDAASDRHLDLRERLERAGVSLAVELV